VTSLLYVYHSPLTYCLSIRNSLRMFEIWHGFIDISSVWLECSFLRCIPADFGDEHILNTSLYDDFFHYMSVTRYSARNVVVLLALL
jgi:hypothetical protein